MYKKILSKILVISVVMSFGLASYADANDKTGHASTNSNIVYGAYVENVGRDSRNLQNNTLDEGKNKVDINDMNINVDKHGNLLFDGTMNKIEFSIVAKPNGMTDSGNVYIYEGNDRLNNFDIYYVSHEKEISKLVVYFNNLRDTYQEVIKIYMRPKKSADFAVIEVFEPEISYPKIISKSVCEEVKDIDMFWYAKAFDAVEEYDEKINYNDTRAKKIVERKGDYKHYFNHLGFDFVQHFVVLRSVEYPQAFNNDGFFTTRLEVIDEYTECRNASNQDSDETFIRIDAARMDIAIDEGDACSGYEIDGNVHKNSSVDLTFGYNLLDIAGIVNVGLTYENYNNNNNDLNTSVTDLSNAGGNYHRQVGVVLDDNRRLEDEGHYLSVKWMISHYEQDFDYVIKDFDYKFTYDMVNLIDYSHWINGIKTLSGDVSYKSY